MDFGRELLRALHVVEREHVGVGAGRSLLEAAIGHAQQRVHTFDELAHGAGVQAHDDTAGVGNCVGGERDGVLRRAIEAAVGDGVAFFAVRHDVNLADDDVVA